MRAGLLRCLDLLAVVLLALCAPAIVLVARVRSAAPLSRMLLDRIGVSFVRHHYYEPIVFPEDLRKPLDEDRCLPALDLNEASQLELVRAFHYREELLSIPLESGAVGEFGYSNPNFGPGDAEMLYNLIRHFKPKRLIEIGSGYSTLMARLAIRRNTAEDSAYTCGHVCVEPYEQPWLENLGVEVVRELVEKRGTSFVAALECNDILFIDSSHVIRPQGDVLFEYLELLPRLAPGVLVHVHDIFTPKDYPARWVLQDRKLWNEQYLLEAFLAFNSEFEVLIAANWLKHHHRDELENACPVALQQPACEPGSFWLRRRPASNRQNAISA